MDKKIFKEQEYYKKKIVEMVGKINSQKILKLIYGLVKSGYGEEIAGRK